jgi:hypothetical protein
VETGHLAGDAFKMELTVLYHGAVKYPKYFELWQVHA